jgi:deoxyuridine 5'-triphosphate nucleotidohydrolase
MFPVQHTDNEFRITRMHDCAKIPTRATVGSAGYDLYASEESIILAGDQGVVKTGIMVEIPRGYCGQVWPRSGFNPILNTESGAGIVDSDYRGELMVVLYNHGFHNFKVKKHMRIAQILLLKIFLPTILDCTDASRKLR